MKGNLTIEVSVTNRELLNELEKRLGIDYSCMYLKDGKVWSDERYDHETLVDPKIFSAYCEIHDSLLKCGKYKEEN